MVSAYIVVKTAAGEAASALDAVRDHGGVEEAHVVAGQYDIVAEATGADVYEVMHQVATAVRDLDGVADTRTYICLE